MTPTKLNAIKRQQGKGQAFCAHQVSPMCLTLDHLSKHSCILGFLDCFLPVKYKPLNATSARSFSVSLFESYLLPFPRPNTLPSCLPIGGSKLFNNRSNQLPSPPLPFADFFSTESAERTGWLIFPNNSVTKKMAGEARRMKSLVIGQVVDGF